MDTLPVMHSAIDVGSKLTRVRRSVSSQSTLSRMEPSVMENLRVTGETTILLLDRHLYIDLLQNHTPSPCI
jgi:hypothetical protein